MGTRIPSHKLSGGLYVSGRPEQPKERQPPTMSSRSVPYTGGDPTKSGELGKMLEIPVLDPKSSHHSSSSQHSTGPARSRPSSGQVGKSTGTTGSGPMSRKSTGSGPIALQPTGLITSGPVGIGSGPIGGSTGASRRSGQLEQTGSMGKTVYGSAVTSLSEEVKIGFRVSRSVIWVFMVVVAMCLLVGVFLTVAVKKTVILFALGGIIVPILLLIIWNCVWGRKGLLGFIKRYPDAELRVFLWSHLIKEYLDVYMSPQNYTNIKDGVENQQILNIVASLGVLDTPSHTPHTQRHVFTQMADFQTGLRALVKAGYGAKVAPFVEPTTVVDVTKENRELSPNFLGWLADRKLSTDDRIMRLKEGYIKEGSTVSVMGIVRRHENVLMIVPPTEPVSTGCQWIRCLLPTGVEGLILTCEDSQNSDVIAVYEQSTRSLSQLVDGHWIEI
ncbi:hypothetical protein TSUD_379820 [Trifolium subterraneum]|uniref:Ubiquitin-specific protease family C19-related protein n=1 Tax=Trifolium subterraneum TaxID=3900 RepID=A0A2Z6MYL1_TRISU|nr:hypothetical protein TSUD_379820 [Trifolium subterraneum]